MTTKEMLRVCVSSETLLDCAARKLLYYADKVSDPELAEELRLDSEVLTMKLRMIRGEESK